MFFSASEDTSDEESACQCRRHKVPSLCQEDPLEEGMTTQSSPPAWRIPWTKEPSGLQSMRSQSQPRLSDWAHDPVQEADIANGIKLPRWFFSFVTRYMGGHLQGGPLTTGSIVSWEVSTFSRWATQSSWSRSLWLMDKTHQLLQLGLSTWDLQGETESPPCQDKRACQRLFSRPAAVLLPVSPRHVEPLVVLRHEQHTSRQPRHAPPLRRENQRCPTSVRHSPLKLELEGWAVCPLWRLTLPQLFICKRCLPFWGLSFYLVYGVL